jgi:hypothetical protein
MTSLPSLRLLILPILAAVALNLGAGRPAPLPLSAKLVLNKDTYDLAAEQSGPAYRQQLQAAGKAGGRLPAAIPVDMTLELTNTSNAPLVITLDADDCYLGLKLEGPGALALEFQGAMTMEFRLGRTVTVEAGKSVSIPIKALQFGMRNMQAVYWTETGEYTLTASYRTKGSNPDAQAEAFFAPAVKVTVKAK